MLKIIAHTKKAPFESSDINIKFQDASRSKVGKNNDATSGSRQQNKNARKKVTVYYTLFMVRLQIKAETAVKFRNCKYVL